MAPPVPRPPARALGEAARAVPQRRRDASGGAAAADAAAACGAGGGTGRRWRRGGGAGRAAGEEAAHGLRHRAAAQVPDLVRGARQDGDGQNGGVRRALASPSFFRYFSPSFPSVPRPPRSLLSSVEEPPLGPGAASPRAACRGARPCRSVGGGTGPRAAALSVGSTLRPPAINPRFSGPLMPRVAVC